MSGVQKQTRHFLRKLPVAEWLVLGALLFLCGQFGLDEVRAFYATRQGRADAQHAIEIGNLQFRIGGKRSSAFNETAIAFHDLCGAILIRSYGCCPTSAQMSYDSAYNDTMEEEIAIHLDEFNFHNTYELALQEGRTQLDLQHNP